MDRPSASRPWGGFLLLHVLGHDRLGRTAGRGDCGPPDADVDDCIDLLGHFSAFRELSISGCSRHRLLTPAAKPRFHAHSKEALSAQKIQSAVKIAIDSQEFIRAARVEMR